MFYYSYYVFLIFSEGRTFAEQSNIDNLKKYDFDVPEGPTGGNYLSSNSFIAFLTYLLFFLVISILAYFTARLVGKHQMKFTLKSKYMEVLDRLSIGSERSLYIVKAPQGLLLLGVTKDGIYLLEKLGAEETELIKEAEANQVNFDKSFANSLGHYLNKIKGNREQNKYGDLK